MIRSRGATEMHSRATVVLQILLQTHTHSKHRSTAHLILTVSKHNEKMEKKGSDFIF